MSLGALATALSPSESISMRPKKRLTARSAMMPKASSDKGSSSAAWWRMKICLVTRVHQPGDAAAHRRGEQHAEDGEQQKAPLAAHIIRQQAAEGGAGTGFSRSGGVVIAAL